MSITIKVLAGRSAAPLQRYRDSLKDGQEPPLLMTTRHCSQDLATQIGEWKAVRQLHGTDGATRVARAAHESVDPETGLHATGERGTHIRERRGERWRYRPVRDGEIPTHLRIEPEDRTPIKQSEALHTIYAAGPDLIHRDDIDGIGRFFDAVVAEREEHYPGLQESIWLERNGESGLVHIHVATNATVYSDFSLDGRNYRAGQKVAKGVTDIHAIRSRFETYLDEHPEHGLRQELPRVGTTEYQQAQRRSSQKDYHDARRGQESGSDRIRRLATEALTADEVRDRASFVAALAERGVEVNETGLRRGKPGRNHDFTYRLADGDAPMKRGVTGRQLGPAFQIAAVDEQLDRKAQGLEVELPQRRNAGPAQQIDSSREAIDAQRANIEPLVAEGQQLLLASASAEALEEDERWEREHAATRRAAAAARPRTREDELIDETLAGMDWLKGGDSTDASVEELLRSIEEDETAISPGAPEPWRSALRDLAPTNPRKAAAVAALAAFEEDHAREALSSGQRLNESLVPRGIGPRILEEFGEHMDPRVREQLQLRVEKRAARSKVFEERTAAIQERFRLEQTGDPRARDAAQRTEQLGTTITRLDDEMRQGIYEMDTPGARQEQHHRMTQRVEQARESDRALEPVSPFATTLDAVATAHPGASPAAERTPAQQRLRAMQARSRASEARERERRQEQDRGLEM